MPQVFEIDAPLGAGQRQSDFSSTEVNTTGLRNLMSTVSSPVREITVAHSPDSDYALMSCGGSVGDGYGPMLVSTRPFTQDEIKQKKIAVPGKLTTAYLALELFAPGIE